MITERIALCGCGAPAGPVAVNRDGKEVWHGWMCLQCFETAVAELAEHRRQFHELLEAGFDPESASKIMIARIDGEAPQ